MKKILLTILLLSSLVGIGFSAWMVTTRVGVTSKEVTPTVEETWQASEPTV